MTSNIGAAGHVSNSISSSRTWKLVASHAGCLWGIEGTDVVSCKVGADTASLLPGNGVTLADEYGQFRSFSLQEKPSSFLVLHGGWVIYEKQNFKGKCLYFYDGDCYSNDPDNKKGPKLKMWQDPIGSVRYLRGVDSAVITVTVEMDWANVSSYHLSDVLKTEEEKNNTFNYIQPTWDTINQVEGEVEHRSAQRVNSKSIILVSRHGGMV